MTDQECRHVADLLAAHEALVHWCETSISAHADLVELTLKLKLEFATTETIGCVGILPRSPDLGALPGGSNAPDGPRSKADRRPRGTRVQLSTARLYPKPVECQRGAQSRTTGVGTADWRHAGCGTTIVTT